MVQETNKTIVGLITLSLMFIWVYQEFIPFNVLSLWILLQTIFIALRYVNAKKLDKYLAENNSESIQYNVRFFLIIIIYSTFVWNFAFIATLIYAPSDYEFLTIAFIMGILTAGIVSISAIYRVFVIYFILMLMPMMTAMFYYGEKQHYAALLFLTIYIPVILILAKSVHDRIISEANITDLLKLKVDELKIISSTDSLTNIYNRRYFFESANGIVNLAKREEVPVGFLMLDIDNFKSINDIHGHQVGDKILVDFSRQIEKMTRSSDVFARVGGEEFALLLYNTSSDNARTIAQNICSSIDEKLFRYSDVDIEVTVSIGVSILTKSIQNIDELYKLADLKLYEAKRAGRNCVV